MNDSSIPKGVLSESCCKIFVDTASKVIEGVTDEHYKRYVKWYYTKKRDVAFNPWQFTAMLGHLSIEETRKRLIPWRIENGKQVEEHYNKIPVPELKDKHASY